MKWWVDPPSGWRYGFPKIWNTELDGTLSEFLKKNNYPDEGSEWVRMWEYKEEESE